MTGPHIALMGRARNCKGCPPATKFAYGTRPVGGVRPSGPLVARSCSRCRELLPSDEFHADSAALFGRSQICRRCSTQRGRARLADPEIRERDRRVSRENKDRKYADPSVRQQYANRSAARAAADPEGRRGYTAAHARVYRSHGSASGHTCADCGGQAREWSLRPNAETKATRLYRWSDRVTDYEPRCTPCHRQLDANQRRGGN